MFTINSASSSAAASTSKASSSSSSSSFSSFSSKRVRLFSANTERRRAREVFKVRAEPAKPKLKKAVRFTVVVVVSNYYRLLIVLFYVYRRNSRLVEAAREATATSKRLRTRLKSAKVRFDLNPEERKKNMRSSFHFIILQEASESPLFPSLCEDWRQNFYWHF